MRVLLVTDWTANEGGIETYVTRVSRGLRAAGHDVRLLTSSVAAGGRAAGDYVAYGTDRLAAQALLQVANPFTISSVRAALREFRPHVAQVNMFEKYLSPAVFPALRDVPTVAVVHYYKPICPTALKVLPDGSLCRVAAGRVCLRSGCVGIAEWLRDRPRYALIRSGLTHAARVLACSGWMAEQLALNGIAAETIPLPVPRPAEQYVRAPARDPVFVYCGRLDREKGPDLLLRAFARVLARRPRVTLRILGDGPRRATLEMLARALGIGGSVRFTGRASFAEVESALAGAWALVAPSLWPEPLGLVAIESITRGVPAITSASGGFAEIVVDGVSGRLVPNGDEDSLVRCLVETVDAGPATIPEPVVRALQARHALDRHTARLTALFDQFVGGRA